MNKKIKNNASSPWGAAYILTRSGEQVCIYIAYFIIKEPNNHSFNLIND